MIIDGTDILDVNNVNFRVAVLFGSYSRGDFNSISDIDVLLIASRHTKSFSKGRINYTIYTEKHLIDMAKNGNLFILHLILEGRVIFGDNFIDRLKIIYKPRKNEKLYQNQISSCVELLEVHENDYNKYYQNLHKVQLYLLRSYFYSKLYEIGDMTFSKDSLRDILGVENYNSIEEVRNLTKPNYPKYNQSLVLLSNLLSFSFQVNENRNIGVVIVNSFYQSKLKYILGLRIINISNLKIEY